MVAAGQEAALLLVKVLPGRVASWVGRFGKLRWALATAGVAGFKWPWYMRALARWVMGRFMRYCCARWTTACHKLGRVRCGLFCN